ncbi:MAG: AMP-binding protein [Deltaproteobacteria bacterium]|nr:AMP-binding protein [Deltaproteobacteria bacterium]
MARSPSTPAKRPSEAAASSDRKSSVANLPVKADLLSVSEIYRGRKMFIMGSTGFVGKVALGMLLDRFPDIGRVYVMVRRGSGTDSETRFWNSVVPSPVFNPLREKFGGAEGLAKFLKEKVRVVDGDITEPNLGMTDEQAAAVAADIDVVLNSSGRVTFNPPVESALRTNVQGTRNVIAFVKRMKRPALVHVSTCFVAGNRSGEVWESEELDGYFPNHKKMPGTKFSVEQEIVDNERIAEEVRAQANDAQILARLRKQARERLLDQGRDPDDEGTLRLAVARERKDWIRNELTRRGMERAAEWGWPNIYTYTKSMGDQLVARETDIVRSIVRPAIVESSESYPFPGWNEGFTTSAPLVYLALKGNHMVPTSSKLVLDMVPVDHICAGMLMVAAQACVEQPALVHQLAAGDVNACNINRVGTLTGLYKRQRLQDKEIGNKFVNELLARMEMRGVPYEEYKRWSFPTARKIVGKVSTALDKMRPEWGGERFGALIDRMKKGVDEVMRVTGEAESNIDLFLPFTRDNEYIFRCDNVRAIRERMPEADRKLLNWNPESLDWYDYFINIHFPGLAKWVLPELDATFAPKPKSIYAFTNLLELFDTSTKLNSTRTAMRMDRGDREEVYSYENLQELAGRAGAFLVGNEVKQGDRVMLFAKNAPDWSMAYFGILKAGGTVVPVGHESTVDELVNIARASGAVGLIGGDDLLEKRSKLGAALKTAELPTRLWSMTEVFALTPLDVEDARKAQFPKLSNADAVASLIFTSGTTGKPKGVMLTHRNLTFMVSELLKVFEFGVHDGMLSVLPLHHTFEFTTGLLVPLSKGAQISYLNELTGDAISRVMKRGHVTAIVGVPALWELLRRRVLSRFSDKSPVLGKVVEALVKTNFELRSRVGLNLGVMMFFPVHEGFGGRIRYLISGGSALPADVLKGFYGLGFDFFEGYGLTETAPVLTVTTPKGKPIAGSVGKPLAGVEVKIADPDAGGVGEVIARGRNVMAGYWQDEQATAEAIQNGWFHTGDLGRFDDDGNLFLVGRSKDIIVDSNGKNVYPDEIEELYRDFPLIKEMSVVGVPDGGGEHVACAVVPDFDKEPLLTPAEVRSQIQEHFRVVSQTLPFWKRVKLLEFWDGDLPRTAKRSIKRREVMAELKRRHEAASQTGEVSKGKADKSGAEWFMDVVARVAGKSRNDISLGTRVDMLAFDSLMYSELASALEDEGVHLPPDTDFTGAPDVAGLFRIVSDSRLSSASPKRKAAAKRKLSVLAKEGEIPVPSPVADLGKKALGLGQKLFYERALDPTIAGEAHIPLNETFIVAANHQSHLDMGLIKVALGDAGQNLASLAAADYFFSDKWRRAYFENFTNLVPMERAGSVRQSLERAEEVLRRGRSMVIFPEGTRSTTGAMRDFLPSLGYLAARARVGILPAYVDGTFDALPKGKTIPRKRKVAVTFGPFLTVDFIDAVCEGLSQQDGWKLTASLVQRIVEGIRDKHALRFDVATVKAAWDGQRLGAIAAPSKKKALEAAMAAGHHPHKHKKHTSAEK